MTTAYSYLRFSTVAQRDGDSLRRQMNLAEDYAAKKALTLDTSHRDLGLSAYKAEHRLKGELGAFLMKVQSGEIERGSYLLIENIDRLTREAVMPAFDLFRSIIGAGITIVTLTDERAYSEESINENWTDLILTLGGMSRAHEESKRKAGLVRAAKQQARDKARQTGATLTKTMPPWIKLTEDRQRLVIAARASIVRTIFRLADEGMGRTKIVRWLHENAIAAWGTQRATNGWHESFISRLLSNRQVLGEFQPHTILDGKRVPDGEPIEGYFPAIVDAALFARVNAHASVRKAMMGGRKSAKIANLVSGLAKCATCGGTMRYREKRPEGAWTTVNGKRYRKLHADAALICSNAERGNGCANRASIAYRSFEKALLDSCLHLALDDQAFSNRGEVGRLNSLIAERQNALGHATAKAERLWSAFADGSEMAKKLAQTAEAEAVELRTNVEAIERQLATAHGRADNQEHLRRIADIRAKLHDPDLTIRVPLRRKVAEALHTLIERIECGSGGSAVHFIAGAALVIIDRKGKVSMAFDLAKDSDQPRKYHPAHFANYLRRRNEARAEGDLFKRTA